MVRAWMSALLLMPLFSTAQVRQLDTAVAPVSIRLTSLPADLATKHYGFFCRQELKWDQKLPVPVRFRLGSQEACDKLEGKYR